MTNPLTEARELVADALAGLPVPVHATPPGQVSGACVWLTAQGCDSRGRVSVEVTVAAPLPGDPTPTVEQVAWDARGLLAAAGLGWLDISYPTVDKDAQLLTRTLDASVRPPTAK